VENFNFTFKKQKYGRTMAAAFSILRNPRGAVSDIFCVSLSDKDNEESAVVFLPFSTNTGSV
jgi:hypothetical protein